MAPPVFIAIVVDYSFISSTQRPAFVFPSRSNILIFCMAARSHSKVRFATAKTTATTDITYDILPAAHHVIFPFGISRLYLQIPTSPLAWAIQPP